MKQKNSQRPLENREVQVLGQVLKKRQWQEEYKDREVLNSYAFFGQLYQYLYYVFMIYLSTATLASWSLTF